MTQLLDDDGRALLEAPLGVTQAVPRLGRALWLYLWLVLQTNARGHVCRTRSRLGHELSISEDQVDRWLHQLESAKLIEVRTPAPYLVIKLHFWPDSAPESQESASVQTRAHAPGSSKQQILKKQASSSREDGGVGEGEMLVRDTLRVLGTSDETEVRRLVLGHPARVVERALRRVERTPSDRIRKSRLALFRYLVRTLSNDPHAHT